MFPGRWSGRKTPRSSGRCGVSEVAPSLAPSRRSRVARGRGSAGASSREPGVRNCLGGGHSEDRLTALRVARRNAVAAVLIDVRKLRRTSNSPRRRTHEGSRSERRDGVHPRADRSSPFDPLYVTRCHLGAGKRALGRSHPRALGLRATMRPSPRPAVEAAPHGLRSRLRTRPGDFGCPDRASHDPSRYPASDASGPERPAIPRRSSRSQRGGCRCGAWPSRRPGRAGPTRQRARRGWRRPASTTAAEPAPRTADGLACRLAPT